LKKRDAGPGEKKKRLFSFPGLVKWSEGKCARVQQGLPKTRGGNKKKNRGTILSSSGRHIAVSPGRRDLSKGCKRGKKRQLSTDCPGCRKKKTPSSTQKGGVSSCRWDRMGKNLEKKKGLYPEKREEALQPDTVRTPGAKGGLSDTSEPDYSGERKGQNGSTKHGIPACIPSERQRKEEPRTEKAASR